MVKEQSFYEFFFSSSLMEYAVCCTKSMQFPSTGLTGRAQATNRGSSGAFATTEAAEGASFDPLIGRKVWTRWPEDNHFYEAVITDYNAIEVVSRVFSYDKT